ncbi:MAG: hypothetical protein C4576_30930 [Desulfobacteraceae bacterium]|nr:MAG: hypothetical protein C4576_30930 [Desulfobacteraceae bacterium]
MIPSWSRIDHLSYLKDRFVFDGECDNAEREKALICASCNHPVTAVSEKTNVLGRHDHAFSYYRRIVRLGCFRNAPGCLGVQGISHGYSWFRGYAWQIQVCGNCHTQLGWKYMSTDESFYGLIFETLRETEAGQESATAA